MKNIVLLFGLLGMIFFSYSCEELGPTINLSGGGGTGTGGTQARNVLIEEFTGVRCKNCPTGSELIETLADTYGSQLVPISIHSGFFSNPYPENIYDFRTVEGTEIETALGSASGWPAAGINRTLYDGASGIIVEKNAWAGYIAQDAAISPMVEIEISKNFNAGTRQLDVTAELNFVETISDPIRISVMITEDNIVDYQKMPDDSKNPDYVHKHVLRGMLTSSSGALYNSTTVAGDGGSQSFSMTLPEEWVVNNCHVVVFAHSGLDNIVFQANSSGLVD